MSRVFLLLLQYLYAFPNMYTVYVKIWSWFFYLLLLVHTISCLWLSKWDKNFVVSVIPRLVLVMKPMFDFTIEEGEQLTIRCTIQNPESLVNIENGSLALTKGGSNLTRKLVIFELSSFYTKVFLFKRNPF